MAHKLHDEGSKVVNFYCWHFWGQSQFFKSASSIVYKTKQKLKFLLKINFLAQKFPFFMIFSTCNPRQNRFCIDISFLVVVFHVSLHHQSNLNGFCCFHCWLHYYKRKIIIKTGNIFYIEKNLYRVFTMFSHTLNFRLWKNGSSYNELYLIPNVLLHHTHLCWKFH